MAGGDLGVAVGVVGGVHAGEVHVHDDHGGGDDERVCNFATVETLSKDAKDEKLCEVLASLL